MTPTLPLWRTTGTAKERHEPRKSAKKNAASARVAMVILFLSSNERSDMTANDDAVHCIDNLFISTTSVVEIVGLQEYDVRYTK